MAVVAVPQGRNLQWEALGTFGYHHYQGSSWGALHITGDTSFAGARLGARYTFGQSRARFFLGLWAVAQSDLLRETHWYADQDFLSDEVTQRKGTLGAVNAGLVLRTGGTFDL